MANNIAGRPNLANTLRFVFLPNNRILKILLAKCTNAVIAMAISIGKNIATTGINKVPKPKPENSVNVDAINAVALIITMSIISLGISCIYVTDFKECTLAK